MRRAKGNETLLLPHPHGAIQGNEAPHIDFQVYLFLSPASFSKCMTMYILTYYSSPRGNRILRVSLWTITCSPGRRVILSYCLHQITTMWYMRETFRYANPRGNQWGTERNIKSVTSFVQQQARNRRKTLDDITYNTPWTSQHRPELVSLPTLLNTHTHMQPIKQASKSIFTRLMAISNLAFARTSSHQQMYPICGNDWNSVLRLVTKPNWGSEIIGHASCFGSLFCSARICHDYTHTYVQAFGDQNIRAGEVGNRQTIIAICIHYRKHEC